MNKLVIGNTEFKVDVLTTRPEREQGFSDSNKPGPKEGKLLIYETPSFVTITMERVSFPLGIAFILGNKVRHKTVLEAKTLDYEYPYPAEMVLEVNPGDLDSIRVGNKVTLLGNKDENGIITPVYYDHATGQLLSKEEMDEMLVLDEEGKVQASLEGEERVFSRKDTKRLFDLAKKANKSNDYNDYVSLGKAVVKSIQQQNEYWDAAKKEQQGRK